MCVPAFGDERYLHVCDSENKIGKGWVTWAEGMQLGGGGGGGGGADKGDMRP